MNIKFAIKLKTETRGQSLVELAISLVIMLMLLLGAIEVSLALFQYVTIRDAAQEGATYGSSFDHVNKTTDEAGIKDHVLSAADDVLILSDSNVTLSYICDATSSAACRCEGLTNSNPNYITVTVQYNHVIAFPLVGPMLGTSTIPLTASTTSTILWPPGNDPDHPELCP